MAGNLSNGWDQLIELLERDHPEIFQEMHDFREWNGRRNQIIIAALRIGIPKRRIAKEMGLSFGPVKTIAGQLQRRKENAR